MNIKKQLEPLVYALVLCVGVVAGRYLFNGSNHASGNGSIDQAIGIITSEYVDTVNREELTEIAIQEMMQKLDPHSVYIAASQKSQVNAPLDGNFEGIGIEFSMVKDTVFVMRVMQNGPADKAGIKVADRLLKANGASLIGLEYDQIAGLIKGKPGSTVEIDVLNASKKRNKIKVVRGSIEIPSIPVSYMLNENIAYLKLDQFSATTVEEFEKAAEGLKKAGMKAMVLDLRNNTGGYLQAAISLLDAFFNEPKLLTYTADRKGNKKEYFSTKGGICNKIALVCLVNEGSASASELFSGAIQDHKRGKIIGNKTYGKGLVQESFALDDGSVLRLTVARYYTPSGKCIQKSYDGLKTKTSNIDGGILPDITIAPDSAEVSLWEYLEGTGFSERELLVSVMQTNAHLLQGLRSADELVSNSVLKAAIDLHMNNSKNAHYVLMPSNSKKAVLTHLYGSLIRDYLGEAEYYIWKNQSDQSIGLARKELLNP